jgi:membrane fusion protein (multidrug efflux system)
VLVTEVKQEDVPIYNEYVGQLDASVNATIEARVQGYLTSQNYKEGQLVKKDDVLFQIDHRPFEAALAQARAAFMQADASARQAELNGQRATELFQRKVSSQQERDNAVQSALAARAQAEAQRAAVEQAQLSLDYTTIKAPVDGIAGLVRVQIGDLINAGTVLTTVTKVDPMKAFFTVSEQRYSEYSNRHADPEERATHEKELRFELILADGSTYPHQGELFALENQVDVRTGSLRIAALFPNPGNILRPGQFARIKVRSDVAKGALVVPQRAVTELQGTYQVAVIGADNKAHVQPVKVGRRVGSEWIIENGLHPGDRIVVEGVQKAREGTAVSPKPWTPPPSPSPSASAAGR